MFDLNSSVIWFWTESVRCCVCLNLCPCCKTEERLEASAGACAQPLLHRIMARKWAAVFLYCRCGLDTCALRGALAACWCCFVICTWKSCVLPSTTLPHLKCWAMLLQSSPVWFAVHSTDAPLRHQDTARPWQGCPHLFWPDCFWVKHAMPQARVREIELVYYGHRHKIIFKAVTTSPKRKGFLRFFCAER